MARIFYYVTIIVGIFALFTIMGMPGSSTSQILNAIGGNSPDSLDYQNSNWWAILFSSTGLISAFGGAAVIVMTFLVTRSLSETAVAGFVGTLGTWIIGDMWNVLKTMKLQLADAGSQFAFLYGIVWFFFIIFIAGAILSLISWWRNSET